MVKQRIARLGPYGTLPAMVLLLVMQACMSGPTIPMGPGSPPPMDPPFDAYDHCIQGTFTNAAREACFTETVQVSHLALPAGTTAQQAYAKYNDCLKKNAPIAVSVGGFLVNDNNWNIARQDCFKRALVAGP